ncbi:MAG: Eco57I restriction-modification methylase domain-containing protein [Candidatus Aminicenantales bacterium]
MALGVAEGRNLLTAYDFRTLFIEKLGWNRYKAKLEIQVNAWSFTLTAIAEKCGMAVFICDPGANGRIPDDTTRRKIERQVTNNAHEHLIIFTDQKKSHQIWQWVRREQGKPAACREQPYHVGQPGDSLIQKIRALAVSLEEEEGLTLPDVTGRARKAFDVERVTKRFYERFKTEHDMFLGFLDGIPDQETERWYISVMLNRLMFVYFIQKKGFLGGGDTDYLKNKLLLCRTEIGKDRYYLDLLCPLFFEGFATKKEDRSEKAKRLLGEVPYLNGGIFMPHQIERLFGKSIRIPDKGFERLFEFFDAYHWHLDERPLKKDDEINPDVLGYIFEKYINQKQMGAYYTKEDITEYISKNTVIPYLFDAAREKCKVAFEGQQSIWRLLQEEPDRYIYKAVRHGMSWDYRPRSIDKNEGNPLPKDLPLPSEIKDGIDVNKSGLLERRKAWNRPAPPEYALPTEIWREVVARRARYEEVRGKLVSGEIRNINDLITYNLDIRQFAQDVVENAEGAELLVAFWKAVEAVKVLDPTCGSGAFLFAALNILDPLYEACLERMQFFIDEWGETGKNNHPNYYRFFTDILKRVGEHPNHRYFVLKSIIINNLYGVDIMEEAVEICKLRLFLKLVAQIEHSKDIEPLPDIDFNIRPGNTLVGFSKIEEVKSAAEKGAYGQVKMIFGETEEQLRRLAEDAEVVDKAFRQFHEMQTEQRMSSKDFYEAKNTLRSRLLKMTDELDRFLAVEYGINEIKIPSKKKYEQAFEQWKKTHQPFHWFAEFYGILKNGGFDVIIGNPPWAEYSSVRKTYAVQNYKTEQCGNLHALCMERSLALRSSNGSFSFIVQLPLANSSRMATARAILRDNSETLFALPFDDRPGKLFEGLQHCRSVILISRRIPTTIGNDIYINRYQRWATEAREILFQGFAFTRVESPPIFKGHFPKYGSLIGQAALQKAITNINSNIGTILIKRTGNNFIFYQEATGYWVKAIVGLPYYSKNGRVGEPAHGRFLYFSEPTTCQAVMALLNSSIFYAYFIAYGDCFHLSDALVTSFPVSMALLKDPDLARLGQKLDRELRADAERITISVKTDDSITYDEFFAWKSKIIIDKIDQVLGKHYGFTEEELDYIVNYDIKYRMGHNDS